MRIHILQHVAFEGLGAIQGWCTQHHHCLSWTRFFHNEPLPDPAQIDLAIVLGGPMGVADQGRYPWLRSELQFLELLISQKKGILGICLGAQLLAHSLGASVTRNRFTEIGWWPISPTKPYPGEHALLNGFNDTTTFHWHGDTFAIPKCCARLASSDACENQAFTGLHEEPWIGLQFHAEITEAGISDLCRSTQDLSRTGPFIQSEAALLNGIREYGEVNHRMIFALLDTLATRLGAASC